MMLVDGTDADPPRTYLPVSNRLAPAIASGPLYTGRRTLRTLRAPARATGLPPGGRTLVGQRPVVLSLSSAAHCVAVSSAQGYFYVGQLVDIFIEIDTGVIERCEFQGGQIKLDLCVFHQPEMKNAIGHEPLDGRLLRRFLWRRQDTARLIHDQFMIREQRLCGTAGSVPDHDPGPCRHRYLAAWNLRRYRWPAETLRPCQNDRPGACLPNTQQGTVAFGYPWHSKMTAPNDPLCPLRVVRR